MGVTVILKKDFTNGIKKRARKAVRTQALVGWFEDTSITYESGLKTWEVAFVNQYGDPENKVPPRNITDVAVENARSAGAEDVLSQSVTEYVYNGGKFDIEKTAYMLQEAMFDRVVNISQPPNAARTVKNKGFNDPLVESGNLAETVSFKVIKL